MKIHLGSDGEFPIRGILRLTDIRWLPQPPLRKVNHQSEASGERTHRRPDEALPIVDFEIALAVPPATEQPTRGGLVRYEGADRPVAGGLDA